MTVESAVRPEIKVSSPLLDSWALKLIDFFVRVTTEQLN